MHVARRNSVGADRDERGKAAGIRTNVLVCLAASLSMILANAMLGTAGKNASSFSVLDLMRLPLGILSGMGFIGAGVILRKGEMVIGVTTAATLWTVTMLGLSALARERSRWAASGCCSRWARCGSSEWLRLTCRRSREAPFAW